MHKNSFNGFFKTTIACLLLSTAGAFVSAVAQDASTTADPEMMLTLKKMYPSTNFREVNRTAVPGIFEVVMGQNVAYVEQTGRYFFFGRLFDMRKQQDLTAGRLDDSNKIDVRNLPLNDAIKTVKGKGTRTLIVFSDPDCPFCKQLEKNLGSLNDVTIYTFMFPLEGLHPGAKEKSVAVWCSKDKEAAWSELLLKGVAPAKSEKCSHPVERNIALAEKLNISGTPTLVSLDGRKLPGAATADRISQWLDTVKVSVNGGGQ